MKRKDMRPPCTKSPPIIRIFSSKNQPFFCLKTRYKKGACGKYGKNTLPSGRPSLRDILEWYNAKT